jgi:Ca-activated chloride channel family protein
MSTLTRIVLLALLSALIAGCGIGTGASNIATAPRNTGVGATNQAPLPANALTISIVYSPEKEAWVTERIAAFNATNTQQDGQPIVVEGLNISSGEARTQFKNGSLKATVWAPSASIWLDVLKHESNNPTVAVSSEPLMLTPQVISMWKPMAEALGWPQKPLGWSDMLALIDEPQGWGAYGHPEWGRFSWGHTDPEISTSGLLTLVAELYAATGKQRDLTIEDVQNEQSRQFIRDLGRGIKHYGYNTLVFNENMRKFGMSYISAFPMDEATVIDFNRNKNPPVPLVAIYPNEGTFWNDHPFIVMANTSMAEQQAAEQFRTFLLSVESQQQALSYGFRPANADVPPADPISPANGVQPQGVRNVLEVPPADVLVAAKNMWAQNRKRADIMLVVDISSSMEGEKLEQVKAGLETFLTRILPEDRVGLVTFASTATVNVPPAPLAESRIALGDAIRVLRTKDKTAVFDGLRAGKQALNALPETDEDRIKAIVLLSDGADNASSITMDQLEQEFEESGISVFPVAYGGDADRQTLQRIVDFSRTLLVEGDTGNIGQIFDNLSRYF